MQGAIYTILLSSLQQDLFISDIFQGTSTFDLERTLGHVKDVLGHVKDVLGHVKDVRGHVKDVLGRTLSLGHVTNFDVIGRTLGRGKNVDVLGVCLSACSPRMQERSRTCQGKSCSYLSMVISLAPSKTPTKIKRLSLGFRSKYSLETQVQKHRKLHYFQALKIIRSTQICASYFRTHLSKEV